MLTPAFVNTLTFFYPIGNTPAVSLTQSLPPGNPANILLLGCGDVRNILFTSHVDDREMDITCCDNQKAVIARNILLLSLIIDRQDAQNDSDNSLWNIYYHIYIDKKSLDILRSQAKKLCELSASMDTWHQSKYGASLAICDSATLADLKKMWAFYSIEQKGNELSKFKRRFESVLNEVKAIRSSKGAGPDDIVIAGFRSAVPAHYAAFADLNDLHHHYWEHGSTELNANIRATEQHPNPTFLPLEYEAILHYATDPQLGFHLATAYAPLRPNDPVWDRIKSLPGLERVVMVARMEFSEWMASYRKRNSNMRIRFFIGDAISFAHTLQNKFVTNSSTANWYRNRYCFQQLQLDGPDYSSSAAPLHFDVIDTSNLCDHVGSLVLLTACSPLLLNQASSVLYTEVISKSHQKESEVLDRMLSGHVPTLSALFDLFPVEYWTNTSSVSASEGQVLSAMANATTDEANTEKARPIFLRLCWKRPISAISYYESPGIRFEPRQLAKVLYEIYTYIFRDEDLAYKFSPEYLSTLKSSLVWYHRASFVSFLRLVQSRVVSDWNAVVYQLLTLVENRSNALMDILYYHELCTYLHLLDSYSSDFLKFWRQRHDGSLSSTMQSLSLSRVTPVDEEWGDLRDWEDIPAVVCVTLKIPRKKLAVFTEINRVELSTPYVHCTLEGPRSQGINTWQDIFGACQLAFGDISTRGKRYDNSFEVSVVEDEAGWNGTSPLIAVFYAPAICLLKEPREAIIAFGIQSHWGSIGQFIPKLGVNMNVYETTLENEASVYITQHGPSQTQFPVVTGFSPSSLAKATGMEMEADASLSASVDEGNGRIVSFTGRLDITGDGHKKALQDGCQVQRSAMSPCEVSIRIGDTAPLVVSFPVYVVENSQRGRISRKSSYIEVIAEVATASQWMHYPDYMYPVLLQDGEPTIWNISYVNLSTCPILDVDQPNYNLEWLRRHLTLMMSAREQAMRNQVDTSRPAGELLRLKFKENLMSIFQSFVGFGAGRCHFAFGLRTAADGTPFILIIINSLRINLADRVAVLDCAILPLNRNPNSALGNWIEPLIPHVISLTIVDDAEMQFWRRVLPACVERCRTWTHRDSCEYVRSGSNPLSTEGREPFLCTCGNGHFPENFIEGIPNWTSLSQHAVRAAISPAFWAPFMDEVYLPNGFREFMAAAMDAAAQDAPGERCASCGRNKREDGGTLLNCARCWKVKYCSKDCQRLDWKTHKASCA